MSYVKIVKDLESRFGFGTFSPMLDLCSDVFMDLIAFETVFLHEYMCCLLEHLWFSSSQVTLAESSD